MSTTDTRGTTMTDMTHRILAADYHRNGIGGAGFYVSVVETTNYDGDGGTDRFLCIDFSGDPENRDYDPGRFAVLRVSDVAKGNIGMNPLHHPDSGQIIEGTGGAAWRGADHWGNDLRPAIRSWVSRSIDALMTSLPKREVAR